MGNLKELNDFDPNNPPDLCSRCPDVSDEFFQDFTPEWLFRLSCAYCGVQLIKNKTILKLIDAVIKDIKGK